MRSHHPHLSTEDIDLLLRSGTGDGPNLDAARLRGLRQHIGSCGACTVHVAGSPVRSCSVSVASVAHRPITTIESLAASPLGSRLQTAWIEEQVPQCGYCQSGQIMAAAALLAQSKRPSDRQIDAAMTNICRCGTYGRIRAAIHRVADSEQP